MTEVVVAITMPNAEMADERVAALEAGQVVTLHPGETPVRARRRTDRRSVRKTGGPTKGFEAWRSCGVRQGQANRSGSAGRAPGVPGRWPTLFQSVA
jgi:hypothetical protein